MKGRLQDQLLIIETCRNCRHNADGYCEKEERVISNALDTEPFPAWCRLCKIDDLKKELMK